MNRSGLASVCLVVSLATSSVAWAQETPPPPPPPPPPPAETPAAPPADTGAGAEGNIDVGASTEAGGSAEASTSGAAVEEDTAAGDEAETQAGAVNPNAERERRMATLHESNSLDGATGLLRVVQASSGAPGTLRFSLAGSYFSSSRFLCSSSSPCPTTVDGASSASDPDSVDRVGMRLGVSATLFPFLEAAFSMRNMATSDSRSRPKLLQVLGDSTLSVKAFMPVEPDNVFQFGGLAQLLLENGAGSVGFAGGGTGFALKALGTAALDNRSNPDDAIPLRFHANVGWLFDNSAALVNKVETTPPPAGRGENIQRTERFGLDINRVDSFQLGIGGEFIHEYVRPFVEWTWDVPVNRQRYVCDENQAAARGELCLAKAQGWATTPSRLSLGARVFPWPEHGLSGLIAVDFGTGATSKFIDEVAPEPPYDVWFGLGWALDTEPPMPIIKEVEKPSTAPAAAKASPYLAGTVVDKAGNAVGGASIRFDGRPLPGFISAEDGTFKSVSLEPGNYTLAISAKGFHDGQCAVNVPSEREIQAAAANPATPPAGGQAAPPVAADGAVSVRCELEALPQLGNVVGQVIDAATQSSIGGAHVKIRDTRSRELDLTADATGSFRFQNVPPGRVTIIADAPGYFTATEEFQIKPLEDVPAHMLLNKRPAVANVIVTSRELKLRQQVHFQNDSAEILPDSTAILEEIADVLNTHPEIKGVEVQGHTDNQGSAPYNLKLSESRAQAVVDALVKLGVDPLRLQAKGYGDTKPLLPNNSDANRAKNRRVQLMVKKD
jgi:outer membrane protein OmpA-like peptidoglycan-associated protein